MLSGQLGRLGQTSPVPAACEMWCLALAFEAQGWGWSSCCLSLLCCHALEPWVREGIFGEPEQQAERLPLLSLDAMLFWSWRLHVPWAHVISLCCPAALLACSC